MPEQYRIRIHWGYWCYYDPHSFFHANHSWDGGVQIDEGRIVESSLIRFSGIWGPQKERYMPLQAPRWHWQPQNNGERFGGVLLLVDGSSRTRLFFDTRSAQLGFTIGELKTAKVIRHHVGPRYGRANVTVLFDGHDPLLDQPEELAALTESDGRWRALLHARDMQGYRRRCYRTDLIWMAPGEQGAITIERPPWEAVPPGAERYLRVTFRCGAMVPTSEGKAPEEIQEDETDNTSISYRILLNNSEIQRDNKDFGAIERIVPLLEELVVDLPEADLKEGSNSIQLVNESKRDHLLLFRAFLEERHVMDPQVLVSPRWVLLGEPFEVVLNCRTSHHGFRVFVPNGLRMLDDAPTSLATGEHRIRFIAENVLARAVIRFESEKGSCVAEIEQVAAATQESFPMRVGLEDNVLPSQTAGLKEQIIRELNETQLGDLFVFRGALNKEQVLDWARLCRENGVYMQTALTIDPRWRIIGEKLESPFWAADARREIGSFYTAFNWSEHDGPLFDYLPTTFAYRVSVPEDQRTMRTAFQDYTAYLARLVVLTRQDDKDLPVAIRSSVVGHYEAYAAGMDIGLAQINKSHNAVLLSEARGASRACDKPIWGGYIAEGAHLNPEGEEHLRMWWLALHFSYICGASFANDEECLIRSWHNLLYAHGDRMSRLRQEILRRFNRMVKTHPRRGVLRVKQALLRGRFACDVADGFCSTSSGGPWVWNRFGARSPQWHPLTPEYGWRYLDVFFPGAWLQSLVQSPERIRRLYAGTPYGELELLPLAADVEVLRAFPLLLLLGWNTMDEGSYEKLRQYVEGGGCLFMSVPQLTTNESRDFLVNNLEPLNLLRGGDFTDLFGLRVKGRGDPIHSIVADDSEDGPVLVAGEWPLAGGRYLPLAEPGHAPVDLAEIELRGASVVACDGKSGKPVLARNRLGQGEAYLLLTHDFPGNSWLAGFMTDLIHGLAGSFASPIGLEDLSGEVYYTVREEPTTGLYRIHLLNTDWTEPGNEKRCVIRLGNHEIPIRVREGRMSEVLWVGNLALLLEGDELYVEEVGQSSTAYSLKVHGIDRPVLRFRFLNGEPCDRITIGGQATVWQDEGEWSSVRVEFGSRSTVALEITSR